MVCLQKIAQIAIYVNTVIKFLTTNIQLSQHCWDYKFISGLYHIDQLICELYNCSRNQDLCYHGYEVCSTTTPGANTNIEDHSCQSVYEINSKTRKLELKNKGCMYTQIQGQNCTELTSCHIDNPLEGDENDLYYCCCGNSLCNQNVTFTHPTEVAIYGE